jgi:hypothetical protein
MHSTESISVYDSNPYSLIPLEPELRMTRVVRRNPGTRSMLIQPLSGSEWFQVDQSELLGAEIVVLARSCSS